MPVTGESKRPGTLSASIEETALLLDSDPSAAAARSLEILRQTPGLPQALDLFVTARRRLGDLVDARRRLETLAAETPRIAAIHYELGLLWDEIGDAGMAVAALSRAAEIEPRNPQSRRILDHAMRAGAPCGGLRAHAESFEAGLAGLRLRENAARAAKDQLPRSEVLLREWLNVHPTDVSALHMLGSLYIRLQRYDDAGQQLSMALDLAPASPDGRWMLAGTCYYQGRWEQTLLHAEKLLENDPEKAEYLDLKSYALLHLGEFEAAVASYERSLLKYPSAEAWKSYGHALAAIGRQEEAIAAYRKAISIQPDFGLAYWYLADLKTFRFLPGEVEAMKNALARPDLSAQNRARIHFALGKALEDEKQYELSFTQYEKANAAVRETARHDGEAWSSRVRASKKVFTAAFFRERPDWGVPASGPIFVVGLPRSGTTLIEQILASHSQVEATSELQVLESVAQRLSGKRGYPESLRTAGPEEIRATGEEYLAQTRVYRKLNRPFFIDKMPNNFNYLGLILLILPKARIIDARRHPLGSGFAIFKHYFAEAYSFAFDLAEIGHYYRNYVELMAHFDAVAPGRVHRVFYERMVADTEVEIRRLLDYCGLPFEQQCLRFYESKRAVLTPSSEQVRRPIFAEAADLWRHYQPWLGTLKSALGDVLEAYPGTPEFQEKPETATWQISSISATAKFV